MYEQSFLLPATLDALGAQRFSYSKRFTIAAAPTGTIITQGSGPITIQGGQPFLSERQSISFPTTRLNVATVIDDGVCRLALQLKKNTSLQLYDAAINLALFAVPGRQSTQGALTILGTVPPFGHAPNIPGVPFFQYFAPGTKFEHTFENSSDVAAIVDVMYDGWTLDGKIDTDEKFWKVIRECQPPMRAF